MELCIFFRVSSELFPVATSRILSITKAISGTEYIFRKTKVTLILAENGLFDSFGQPTQVGEISLGNCHRGMTQSTSSFFRFSDTGPCRNCFAKNLSTWRRSMPSRLSNSHAGVSFKEFTIGTYCHRSRDFPHSSIVVKTP